MFCFSVESFCDQKSNKHSTIPEEVLSVILISFHGGNNAAVYIVLLYTKVFRNVTSTLN
jgi:hypothetical protein